MASTAKEQSSEVAHTAVDKGKDVASQAASQASAVAGQAKEQLTSMVGQAKGEVQSQVETRTQQAAEGLHAFSKQLSALSEGRPQEAGHVGTLISDAQQRVQAYSTTLQERGPQALAEDVSAFARRRPMTFLAAAAVAGFAAGRLARAGAAASKEMAPFTSAASSAASSTPASAYDSTGGSGLDVGTGLVDADVLLVVDETDAPVWAAP
jgi:hypothetical protein